MNNNGVQSPAGAADRGLGCETVAVLLLRAGRVPHDFRLTLDFGLRYEISDVPFGMFGATDPESLAAVVPGPVKKDTNNWAPRAGFAYSPHTNNRFIGEARRSFAAASVSGTTSCSTTCSPSTPRTTRGWSRWT